MSRASFSDEFKRDAVAQITTRGYSYARTRLPGLTWLSSSLQPYSAKAALPASLKDHTV